MAALPPVGEPSDLERLYEGLEARIAQERGPAAWLRARSTPTRALIASAVIVGVTLGFGLLAAKPDSVDARGMLTLAAIAGVLVPVLAVALRPLHLPAAPTWLSRVVPGAGLLLLLAIYLLPSGAQAASAEPGAVMAGALGCLAMGAVLGVPIYALLRVLDRGNSMYGVASALAAGLAANLLLQLHCPHGPPLHMVLGHLGVAVAFVLGYVALRGVAASARA